MKFSVLFTYLAITLFFITACQPGELLPHQEISDKYTNGNVSVKISVDQHEYTQQDIMTLTLTNMGTETIWTGTGYSFNRYESEKWRNVDLELAFDLAAKSIKPGDTFVDKVSLSKLRFKPGKYRVIKSFIIQLDKEKPITKYLAKEFTLK